MKKLSIEYQIVIDTKTGLCKSNESFKNLLSVNSKINVTNREIIYDDSIYNYTLELAEYPERNQNVFTLEVSIDATRNSNKFQSLLKIIRELLHKTSISINILWDDLSTKYCEKAYPEINHIENLLRKLITKFMVNTVGIGWTEDSLPKDFKTSIKKENRESYSNILHSTDFIQLADFLFKPYANQSVDKLLRKLKNDELSNLNKDFVETFIPKSNWERYFSSLVNCDDNYLKKRWERLYELRCLVAHNSFFTKKNLKEVKDLCKDIRDILSKAMDEIGMINIPQNEKEDLLENAVKNNNESYASFLNKWKELELSVISHVNRKEKFKEEDKKRIIAKIKQPKSLFGSDKMVYRRKINALINVRRQLVHQVKPSVSEKRLLKYIEDIDDIISGLK